MAHCKYMCENKLDKKKIADTNIISKKEQPFSNIKWSMIGTGPRK